MADDLISKEVVAAAVLTHLENWASDLYATSEEYLEAMGTGTFGGRKITRELAKRFAMEFNDRAEAVEECIGHTIKMIQEL